MKTTAPTFIVAPAHMGSSIADRSAFSPTRKFLHHPVAQGRSFAEILAATARKSY